MTSRDKRAALGVKAGAGNSRHWFTAPIRRRPSRARFNRVWSLILTSLARARDLNLRGDLSDAEYGALKLTLQAIASRTYERHYWGCIQDGPQA